VLNQLHLPPETLLSLSDDTGDLERARKHWEILFEACSAFLILMLFWFAMQAV
jgi:hypothetical protein